MGQIWSEVKETIIELNLGDKLLPWRNRDIAWFWVFLPAFLAYMYLLMGWINAKPPIGVVEIINANEMKKLFYLSSPSDVNTTMHIIADGMKWAEGPLWIIDPSSTPYLEYSDTIRNRLYRWDLGKGFFTVGKTITMHRAGCRTNATYCAEMYEPGANGLIRVHPRLRTVATKDKIDLITALHGERAIALFRENGTRSMIATHYQGHRFNSPNDLVYSPEGHLYFTDPPYGLYNNESKFLGHLQELNYSGVFMISVGDLQRSIETGQPTTNVRLLHSDMTRPNGLAFSPDFSKMYISNSDPAQPQWRVFDVTSSGALVNGKVFFDASSLVQNDCNERLAADAAQAASAGDGDGAGTDTGSGDQSSSASASKAGGEVASDANQPADTCSAAAMDMAVPDGFKVDINGNLLASGPGGILIISPQAELLGRLRLPLKASNLAFSDDGYVYITATDKILRMRVRTKSAPLGEHSGKR